MIVKVSQVAAEFRRVSNKQMADTTKRTIKENVLINNQLHKMSKKVTDLMEDSNREKEKVVAATSNEILVMALNNKNNNNFKDKVKKQQIDLLEENEKELAKKNVSNLKVLRMLTEKCHSQEAIIVELEDKFNELSELNLAKDAKIQDFEIEM